MGVGVRCVGAIYGILQRLPICAQCSVLDNSTRRASCVDGLKMGSLDASRKDPITNYQLDGSDVPTRPVAEAQRNPLAPDLH